MEKQWFSCNYLAVLFFSVSSCNVVGKLCALIAGSRCIIRHRAFEARSGVFLISLFSFVLVVVFSEGGWTPSPWALFLDSKFLRGDREHLLTHLLKFPLGPPLLIFFGGESFFHPLKSASGAYLVQIWCQNDLTKWAWVGFLGYEKTILCKKHENSNPPIVYYISSMATPPKTHSFWCSKSFKVIEKWASKTNLKR